MKNSSPSRQFNNNNKYLLEVNYDKILFSSADWHMEHMEWVRHQRHCLARRIPRSPAGCSRKISHENHVFRGTSFYCHQRARPNFRQMLNESWCSLLDGQSQVNFWVCYEINCYMWRKHLTMFL